MESTPETIKAVMVGDTEIQYSERGEGEPLLLVHAGVFADWFVPLAASPRSMVSASSECDGRATEQTRPPPTSPLRTMRPIWRP